MKDIYLKLTELIENRSFFVLATIIKQEGSSPSATGTKCIIMDDGSFAGSVGGGIIEAQTLREAKKVFDSGSPIRLYFSLDGSAVAETDMLCGGRVEVFLEPVSPENHSHFSIFDKLVKINKQGGAGLLATVIDQDRWSHGSVPKMFMDKDGEATGSLLGGQEFEDVLPAKMDQILKSRQPVILPLQDEAGNRVEIFVEPIASVPVLYVFGGGHVSRQVVPLANRVGFQVIVIDDRREFTQAGHFPGARDVHQLPFEGVMDRFPVEESAFLVILTRGHVHDMDVLAQALKTKAGYIGMIGSRRKTAIIHEKLLEEGFTEADLSRVHAPIGLEIGAETPAEIAVSIVAELIKVRAGKFEE